MMDCALFEDQKEKQTYREFNLSEKTQRTCAGAHTHTHTHTDQYSHSVNEREIINAVREHRKVLMWPEKASE